MEVASPLTFGYVQSGTKRRFACSPILDATMGLESSPVDDYKMDDCATYGHALKKRRRIGSNEEMNNLTSLSSNTFPPPQTVSSHGKSINQSQKTFNS